MANLKLDDGDIKKLKGFFGLKPGAKLKDFSAELKALTTDDRAELIKLIDFEIGAGAI